MSDVLKFSGILLMSAFAFMGVYLLKLVLTKLIPPDSTFETVVRTMPLVIYEAKFWLGGLCYVAAMAVYLFLLQGDEVSTIFPIAVGVNILLTTVGAVLLLGDTMDVQKIAGIFFIVAGTFLIHNNG